MTLPALTVPEIAALPVPARPEYAVAVRRFNAWLDGRTVNEESLRAFFAAMRKEFKARTLEQWKVALRAAVVAGFDMHDTRALSSLDYVFRSIKLPKREAGVSQKDLFTRDELRKVFRSLPLPYSLFFRALYNSGARISELLSARVSDCTEDRGAVLVRITGKGGKERTLVLDAKLYGRIRKVWGGEELLFGSRKFAGKKVSRKYLHRMLDAAARERIGRRMHPHALRHSRITHLIESGESLKAVSFFAGHSQIKTTLEFYSHNTVSSAVLRKSSL